MQKQKSFEAEATNDSIPVAAVPYSSYGSTGAVVRGNSNAGNGNGRFDVTVDDETAESEHPKT